MRNSLPLLLFPIPIAYILPPLSHIHIYKVDHEVWTVEDELYTTLAQIQAGQSCIVLAIIVAGRAGLRLLDMGITPGAEITVARFAPLGDPMQLYVRGYSLSIRKKLAAQITVLPLHRMATRIASK